MKVAVFADLRVDLAAGTWAPPDVRHRRRLRLPSGHDQDAYIAAKEDVRASAIRRRFVRRQDNFEPDTGEFIRQACRFIAPDRGFFAPGNHGAIGPASPVRERSTGPPTSTFSIPDRVSGCGSRMASHFRSCTLGTGKIHDGFFNGFRMDAEGMNLALFHGSEQEADSSAQGEGKKPHGPFDKSNGSRRGSTSPSWVIPLADEMASSRVSQQSEPLAFGDPAQADCCSRTLFRRGRSR